MLNIGTTLNTLVFLFEQRKIINVVIEMKKISFLPEKLSA